MDADKHQRLQDYLQNEVELEHKDAFEMSDMILQDDSPDPLDYVETDGHTENTHAGQMKLLLADEMSIMLGLLHICEQSDKTLQDLQRSNGDAKVAVVVAGAAPGDHFADLRDTFRFVDFHLYDPAPKGWCRAFHDRRRLRNVTLNTQYFEVQTAQEWQGNNGYEHVIFLCDLRVSDAEFPTPGQVSNDMDLQHELTKTMQACYSVLKFRPRYYFHTDPQADDYRTLKYFDGTVYLQGYPPKTSTETRLHVTDTESEKEYDTLLHEKQLFYHNQVTRNKEKRLFGPNNLSYDNAHARFVKEFLEDHLGEGSVSEKQHGRHGQPKFDHWRLRALLEQFKLLMLPLG
jgi:hypothetical protein